MFALSHNQADLSLWADALMLFGGDDAGQDWQLQRSEEGIRIETRLAADSGFAVRGQAVLRTSCEQALRLLAGEADGFRAYRVERLTTGGFRVDFEVGDAEPRRVQCLLTPVASHLARLVWEQQNSRRDGGVVSGEVKAQQVEQCWQTFLRLRAQARQNHVDGATGSGSYDKGTEGA